MRNRPKVTYQYSRLTFHRDSIEPLRPEDVFRVETPIGIFEMSKLEFYETFPNVVASKSYSISGLFNYSKAPKKADCFRVDEAQELAVSPTKKGKYRLPSALHGACTESAYKNWLHRKAVAHVVRDRKRWGIPLSVSDYKKAIHAAVLDGGERDAYTGELLNWGLISTYDNKKSQEGGVAYKKTLALLPTVDHATSIPGDMNFRICAWRTNDSKSDLSVEEFTNLCRKVLQHNSEESNRPASWTKIPGIRKRKTPAWLQTLNGLKSLPIKNVLRNSLYYPSCGRDGDPVRYLAGYVHSFVYVDCGLTHDEVWNSLHSNDHGFRGYSVLACRDVSQNELVPDGWQPVLPTPSAGTPAQWHKHIKMPFALWCVYERDAEYREEHGPSRFSLLYICGDGAATFQALYSGNRCAPDMVAIIQPGTGFGFNWTDFRNPRAILGKSILENPAGMPRYLLYGGWGQDYRQSCWPHYSHLVHYWSAAGGKLGLWRPKK